MSINALSDSNHYIDWLERSIADEHIKYYEYSDFKNIRPIGNGSYGKVNSANWKNTDHFFALKSFNSDKQTLEEIIKEKPATDSTQQIKNYSLVLECANGGTLNTYLGRNFNDLDWDDKYRLALQLADAIEFLHDNDIVHRDLHPGNILIHQNSIKLTDFGLSKKVTEASSITSKIQGVMPYVDPKKLNDKNYKLDKKPDVYSIGVLLWQISSGHKPFEGIEQDVNFSLSLIKGTREKIIDGTPVKYSKLYTECWKYESNQRPNMCEVILTLKEIISPGVIVDSLLNEDNKSTYSSEKYGSISKTSKTTVDINNDLNINNSLKLSTISHIESLENSNMYESRLSSQNHMEFKNTSSSNKSGTLDQISIDMNETITVAMADWLIDYIVAKHDSGITFDDQIRLPIIKKILQYTIFYQLLIKRKLQPNQNFNLIDWLSSNKDVSKYGWLLGLFYYYNIGFDEKEDNSIKSFKLFSKAANDNYLIAQVYLAKCYYDGHGTTLDHLLAFKYYLESAKNGSIIGQFCLGNFYESILNNEKESVYWYKKAAKSGKGTEKDEIKAFQYYEALANKEIADAQLKLGDCFYNGIGTKLDITQAKYWYEKAANNGSIIAKNNLKEYYNEKIRFEIDKHKFYYKMIFSAKRLTQFGLYYIGKILLKTNYEKSFYYLQKAAANGCKFAQFNLGGCYQLGHGVRKDIRKAFELYKKSAEQEYINAQSQLIYYYGYGLGTEINRVKAFELVKIIAEKGFKHAQYLLGLHYRTGEGVDKDEIKAFKLFEKLAKESTKCLSYNNKINEKRF
ncbi:kinase-like protein [Rhizophagus irregularis]|uniref:Kinase-like protein n=1 Tax=Rhizophagus irregularis TaxID=588596 RepID=A0A2I1HFU9_9GLOM|nr:kinase-like protein [Rhizophagus irregularis]